MARSRFLAAPLPVFLFAGVLFGQTTPTVDFARDIQPLLRQNCVGCHGPAKQNGGMRLDRKSSALKPLARRIVPGSSENSFVYHRVADTNYGPPMPPTGELKSAEVALIKNWIDQGAPWPDALANDKELPPIDPHAVQAVEALRSDDRNSFLKMVQKRPGLLNARGPEGSTPFMYAVLYTGPETLKRLIAMGAKVNAHNDANATALMWAAHDLEKTRVLLRHGANVNARSDDFRTPLMIAARRPGGSAVVALLLQHGANANPNARPETMSSPLLEAVTAGDAASFEMLLHHGAKVTADGQVLLSNAIYNSCDRCVDLLMARITDKDVFTGSLQDTAYLGDVRSLKLMLDKGADATAYDPLGRTALMYAAVSDLQPLEAVKLLVAHGADVHARSRHTKAGDANESVLEMARLHGETPVVQYLLASGAKDEAVQAASLHPRLKNEIRGAVEDSLPLLQRADANFATNTGCVSCHNNSLTAMTVGLARTRGIQVDEAIAKKQVQTNSDYLKKARDLMHQGFLISIGDTFSDGVMAYILMGLNAEGFKPDLSTDAAAMHILWRQQPNGQWLAAKADTRQPLCLDYVGETAMDMRALQLYMPMTDRAAYEDAIRRAAVWMASAATYNNDDRSWRVAGLAWAGTNKAATQEAMQELLAAQKADGGWSDLPTMDSTAYATGKSLVALHIAGLPVSDPAYERGTKWLLTHQEQDGSWFVRTRALAFQPAFDAGFPHGHNQWISSAGTNWADMALLLAMPEQTNQVASLLP